MGLGVYGLGFRGPLNPDCRSFGGSSAPILIMLLALAICVGGVFSVHSPLLPILQAPYEPPPLMHPQGFDCLLGLLG